MTMGELQSFVDSIDRVLWEAEEKLHEKYWYWKHSEELADEEEKPIPPNKK